MNRLAVFGFICVLMSTSAFAQNTGGPSLYVGSGKGGGSSLYNSNQNGNGAGKPISLKQIIQGTNTTGNEYSREGTGFTPYGTKNMYRSGSISPSTQDLAAYRAQQARETEAREQKSKRDTQARLAAERAAANNTPEQQTQQYINQFQPAGTAYQQRPATYTPPRQTYAGRDLGVREPTKVFKTE